jgi:DNA topoisomerase-1
MATKQFYTRRRDGRGFEYFWNGQPIKDRKEKKYFASLGIPPAWKDVKISTSKRSRILATGTDKAGRMQYIYHPSFRARMEKEKFERTLRFAEALPRMRRTTAEHLNHPRLDKQKVLACIVRLMDVAYFRVGNEVYAEENQSYGLTTLRRKHIQVKGHTIIFDFIGKSGQEQFKEVTSKKLARVIKRLEDLPGYEIFKYYDEDGKIRDISSDDVNAYIKDIMGEEFSAKDFRTWGGTVLASAELAAMERPATESERRKAVAASIKKVAEQLGNTPAITRGSYVDPRVINAYLNSNSLARIRETVERMDRKSYLSSDERILLELLQSGTKTK